MKKIILTLIVVFLLQNITAQTTYILCGKLIDVKSGEITSKKTIIVKDNKILDVLDKIKYGTDSVLENLTKNISQLFINNKFYQDIDVKEDLPKVYKVLKEKNYSI